MDRLRPAIRPRATPIGFQRWHDLLFLHWDLPPDVLRPLVPPRLEVDTFEGRAFVTFEEDEDLEEDEDFEEEEEDEEDDEDEDEDEDEEEDFEDE